jgi:hypothetical protein
MWLLDRQLHSLLDCRTSSGGSTNSSSSSWSTKGSHSSSSSSWGERALRPLLQELILASFSSFCSHV